MVFKKSLIAVVFALPLILGIDLVFFILKTDVTHHRMQLRPGEVINDHVTS